MRRLHASSCLFALVLLAAGCSKYTPVPVRGEVTLDGQPVEGATVNFYAVGDAKEGRPAMGVTDSNGCFTLSTLGKDDGALKWDYKVVITKYVPTKPNLKVPTFPDTPEGRAQKEDFFYNQYAAKGIQPYRNALPPQYGDSNNTPLTCKVTGDMDVKFELKSK